MADPQMPFMARLALASPPPSTQGSPLDSSQDGEVTRASWQPTAAAAATTMPPQTNLQTLTVIVGKAAGDPTKVPQFPYTQPGGTQPAAPTVWVHIWEIEKFKTAADQTTHDRRQAALLGRTGPGAASTPPTPKNRFIVAIPGYIQETTTDPKNPTFQFRLLDKLPKWNDDVNENPCGWFGLSLAKADGTPWVAPGLTSGAPYCVQLLGNCESEVDLACVLQTDATPNDALKDTAWEDGVCFHMTNLVHIIQSQIDEGGICIAMFLDESGNLNDNSFRGFGKQVAQRLLCVALDVPSDQLVIGANGFKNRTQVAATVKSIMDKINSSPILSLSKPAKVYRLALCTHGWHQTQAAYKQTWSDTIPDPDDGETDAKKQKKRILVAPNDPRLGSHASNDYPSGFKIQGGSPTMPLVNTPTDPPYPSGVTPDVETFLNDFVPLLSPNVIFSLFACATGLGNFERNDGHGNPPPAGKKRLGEGSVADGAFRFLRRLPQLQAAASSQGTTPAASGSQGTAPATPSGSGSTPASSAPATADGPVVWSHTAYGESIHNFTMRVFANHYDLAAPPDKDGYDVEGGRDFFWLKPGVPPPWIATPGVDPPVKGRGAFATFINQGQDVDTTNMIIDLFTSRPGKTLQAFLAKFPDKFFPTPPPPPSQSSSQSSSSLPPAMPSTASSSSQ
ncbi:MAG TPA: hypothetical protein VFF73_34150 [Planctomycetota bacterium]|nr:hypothetical protein [Planctomycetota bacterium]